MRTAALPFLPIHFILVMVKLFILTPPTVHGVTVLSFRDAGDMTANSWAHWGQLHKGSMYTTTMVQDGDDGDMNDYGGGGGDTNDDGGGGDDGEDANTNGGDNVTTTATIGGSDNTTMANDYDGAGGDDIYYSTPPENLTLANYSTLTVCYHLRLTGGHEAPQNIFNYYIEDYSYISVTHGLDKLYIYIPYEQVVVRAQPYFLQWSHYCIVLDAITSQYSVYQNGILLEMKPVTFNMESWGNGGGYVTLGQYAPEQQDNVFQTEPLIGQVAEFNVWSEVLSADEVEKVALCEYQDRAPNISFSVPSEWMLNDNVTWIIENSTENMCSLSHFTNNNNILVSLGKHQRDDGVKLCRALGGRLPTPTNDTYNDHLKLFAEKVLIKDPDNDYPLVMLGISTPTSGWVDLYSGVKLNDTRNKNSFYKQGNQRNPDAVVVYDIVNDSWDETIYQKYYLICEIPLQKYLVRGLYDKSPFGNTLWVRATLQGELVLCDHTGSLVRLENKHWNIIHTSFTEVRMNLDGTLFHPLGLNKWMIWDEKNGKFGQEEELLITPCPVGQYTCWDLSCISENKVCDSKFDCPDNSDEELCERRLLVPSTYNKVPPASTSEGPFSVKIDVQVINFRKYSITDMKLAVDLKISMSWKDPRLRFFWVQEEEENYVISLGLDKIWTPQLVFISALGATGDQETMGKVLIVRKDGNPLPNRLSSVLGDEFDGSAVKMHLNTHVVVTSTCDPDLYKFPFDTQTCYLFMPLYVNVVVGNITTLPLYRSRLLEYEVENMTLTLKQFSLYDSGSENLVLTTRFRHLYGYYIISIYLPTLLLILISYATFFFNFDDFTDRIMVSVTALLVLSTFLSTASSSMARVSYLTLIDIWLSFSIGCVFIICISHTVLLMLLRSSKDHHHDKKEQKPQQWAKMCTPNMTLSVGNHHYRATSPKIKDQSKNRRYSRVDAAMKVLFPVALIIFLAVYFFIGLVM
ncbi:hypothetical protein Pmani_018063 [Petrolisthes manimaculis]|uniref:Uncharacterized protein n=1 Tax=Petrolisthes manimaculis TaxID=1843537 RepID=A0AAE1U8R3_9EUCA|nr:hypothetical protein Pmani_018063 [Petrolisthes manimaculis]